jgi:uncharacterized membrane protein
MAETREGWTDEQVEKIIGDLLRVGVLLAASVILVGGVLFLARYGGEVARPRTTEDVPEALRSPLGILGAFLARSRRGIIQFGVLLLIATPVARVAFSVFAFLRQHDYLYVFVTLIVLVVLLYSFLSGLWS